MNLDELLKAAMEDPSGRSIFLQTLIRSDIFVICQKPVQPAEHGHVCMELITVYSSDGQAYIPFFTSHRGLQRFAGRYVECYRLNCLKFFDLIQNMSAVLNPDTYGREFHSPEIKTILHIARNLHIKPVSYNDFEVLTYCEPQRSLSHIIKPALKFFNTQPNVDRAFIVEMRKGSEKPQLLMIVDMLGNTRKLFVALARHLARINKENNEHLYFLSYEQELAKKAVRDRAPFYVRSTKRYFQR